MVGERARVNKYPIKGTGETGRGAEEKGTNKQGGRV